MANAAIFIVAAIMVWIAGARLARYADQVSDKTGLGEGLLGLVMLGAITSLPELAVGVTAAASGTPTLAVNDVLGSASINLVILALADAVYGRRALTSTPPTPQMMLQSVLVMLILALIVAPTVAGDVLLLGIGAWSWLMIATFAGSVWLIVKAQGRGAWVPADAKKDSGSRRHAPARRLTLRQLMLRTAAVAVVILVAGFLLARTGAALAEQTGLGTSFVGASMLATATSLPEVSTVLAAVRLKRYEMAISDVLSTNLFNVMIIVLVDAIHPGEPVLVEAGPFAAFGALLAIVLTGFFLVGMIERRDRTVLRMGLDSLAVLLCYGAGIGVLYQLR